MKILQFILTVEGCLAIFISGFIGGTISTGVNPVWQWSIVGLLGLSAACLLVLVALWARE